MKAPFLDAHLHLQDARLEPCRDAIVAEMRRRGIARWVVAGTREADWPEVARLAERYPEVMPCYGLHPWQVAARGPDWEAVLAAHLARPGAAAVGEIGLDHWIRDPRMEDQEAVFRIQLRLAAGLGLPVVIHCLKAWGRLLKVLREESPPPAGFLLHSFSGPDELAGAFVELGGHFSFSGHFLHPRKAAVVDTFRRLPLDRLLVETDAPDMRLPAEREICPLASADGEPLNHPANLPAVYQGLAEALGLDGERLAEQVAGNFRRFFGFAATGDPL